MSFAFALLLQVTGLADLSSIPLDPNRVIAETAADQDVIRSLKSDGDVPSIIRPVDLRFKGSHGALHSLEADLKRSGWTILQTVKLDHSEYALDVQTNQTTDPAAIHSLTETALRIGVRYAVDYDGWGCVAQTGHDK